MKKQEIKIDDLKNYIKGIAQNEISLKSISFSVNDNEKDIELICYFTWKKEFYDKFFKERDIFRQNVISYLKTYNFKLNIKKSNPARYVFVRAKN